MTIDERATMSVHTGLRLSGTYWCEGASERLGSFIGDVRDRRGGIVADFGLDDLRCDGVTRAWQLDVPAPGALPGQLWASGLIMVCESEEGPCPGKLFEGQVLVTPER